MPPAPLTVIDPFHALARRPDVKVETALAAAVAELDRFGIERAGVCLDREPELARAALAAFPARFFARCEADPCAGLTELRRLEALAREHNLRAATLSPARLFLPLDDARCYPLFAKCVELDVALCPSVGVPRERVPFSPQKPERLDPVACHFPELRIVMRGGAEPWQALAVLLMRRHPNLSFATAGLAPSELPPEVLAFANEDGAHRVLFASEPPAAGSAERFYKGLPELGLARHVWPLFARDNSARILKLL
jgi:hypothetical protein